VLLLSLLFLLLVFDYFCFCVFFLLLFDCLIINRWWGGGR